MEVGVFTDASGEQSCVSLWNLSNGVLLKSFKNGVCAKNGIDFIGRDYVIVAQHQKQLIHIYDTIKDHIVKKIVCPGRVTCLAVSPDGKYCIVALVEKIYIWQLCTGKLMNILSKHYQAVTTICFTQDGAFFLTAGNDNLLIVWNFASVLQPKDTISNINVCEQPLHTLTHHSMPIKDIHVGVTGMRCRVVTCSLDQTCKVFDLLSGEMLCCFVFSVACSSVTMDVAENYLFTGTLDGYIFIVNCHDQSGKEIHVPNQSPMIKAHDKEITSLSVFMDGTKILSGSLDCSVKLWHLKSKQCLRTFSFKGAVTNAFVIPYPPYLEDEAESIVKCNVENFKRTTAVHGEDVCSWSTITDEDKLPILLKDIIKENANANPNTYLQQVMLECICQQNASTSSSLKTATRSELLERIEALETMAQEFYSFATEKLAQSIDCDEEKT